MVDISVLVCTFNPLAAHLEQTLEGLKRQSLHRSAWELLLLDNASSTPIATQFAVAWHPHGRHLVEARAGKTNALLRGIRESKGQLIVTVDDDNVLDPNYLEEAARIAAEWPRLGTWGGSIAPRFEEAPPSWLKQYECYLSIREVLRDQWFNLTAPDVYGNLPYGAGMCVRRVVAEAYVALVERDDARRQLGPRGDTLLRSEDTDLALLGCDVGFGTGLFSSLSLTHLIRKERLTERYMERMLRDMTYSLHMLAALRGQPPAQPSWARQAWGLLSAWRRGPRELRFHRAGLAGGRKARLDFEGLVSKAN